MISEVEDVPVTIHPVAKELALSVVAGAVEVVNLNVQLDQRSEQIG
jgi:hypothetical protein